MGEGRGFRHVRVESANGLKCIWAMLCQKPLCYASRNLRNFKAMGQSIVSWMTPRWRNNLSYAAESSKSGTVENSVAIVSKCATTVIVVHCVVYDVKTILP